MKSLKSISLLSILAIFLFSSACEKDLDLNNAKTADKYVIDEIPDLTELVDPIISEARIETDIELINDGMPEKIEEGFNEKFAFHGRKQFMLKGLFAKLNLSKEQAEKLKYAMKQHHDCKYSLQMQLRKLNKQIIAKSHAYKKELIEKYKKGYITKTELQKALKELEIKTKKALQENKDRQEIIKKLKACYKNYMESLQLILTKDQWEIYKKYMAQLKGGKTKGG